MREGGGEGEGGVRGRGEEVMGTVSEGSEGEGGRWRREEKRGGREDNGMGFGG